MGGGGEGDQEEGVGVREGSPLVLLDVTLYYVT